VHPIGSRRRMVMGNFSQKVHGAKVHTSSKSTGSLAGTRTAQPLFPSGKPGTTIGIRQCHRHCHCPLSLSVVIVCSAVCQYQCVRVFV
jgi:hypothetical protein